MTRFEEVTRLRELEKKAMHAPWTIKTPEHNDGYQETWIVGPGETGVMPIFDDEDDHLNVAMRNAAPWLLEAAACFQRGDADEIAYARDVLASDSRYTGDPRVWTRLPGPRRSWRGENDP